MRRYLVAMVACSPAAPSTVASRVDPSIEVSDLDRSADPCTDFYQFATGGWRAAHPIPASAPKWSRRMAARETNRRQVQALLDDLSRTNWPAGSIEQLLGDFYASCVDEATAEAAGTTPLAPWLTAIDGARTMADLQRAIRRLHEIGVAVPFGVSGAMAYHEPTSFVANVVGTGLDRDDYARGVDRYRARVVSALKLAGAADAARAADAIVALETRLANASLPRAAAADPVATDHMTTFAQLRQLAPHFEWDTYFHEAHLPRIDLNVADPAYLQRVDKELVETPVEVWKAYLEWHLLDAVSPWLAKIDDGTPRRARCVDSTEALFGELVGRKYAETYFSAAARTKASAIMHALMSALHDRVAAATWMQPATKTTALDKASAIDVEIGYPYTWKPDPRIAIRRDALLANIAAARRAAIDDDRGTIGKPTPRHSWQLPPSSPDAYIEPELNQLVLPAGYLQRPAFDPDATDAYNYGAIGVAVAHDLTHSIDLSGSELDRVGRPANWWTDADRAAFAKLGQCVIDQFDGYKLEPGVHLHGKRVVSEAIGDLAGIRLAFAALETSMANHPVPTVDGFTPEQQFFIAWAQLRGEDVRPEAQRTMVATDPHPIPKFRVNGTLSDSPEFQRAFSCRPGSAMVRPNPCVVW